MLPLAPSPADQETLPVGRLARAIGFVYSSRRRFATAGATALALLIAGHVVFGANGLRIYNDKRKQAAALSGEIETLQRANARLQEHNGRLQQEPHAIEGAIRQRLRYAKPNEVIVQVEEGGH